MKSIDQVHHITCVTPDMVWASDHRNNLILTNTSGDILHHLTELCTGYDGSHAVTSKGELIYIDKSFNIIKLSNDIKKNHGNNIKHRLHMDQTFSVLFTCKWGSTDWYVPWGPIVLDAQSVYRQKQGKPVRPEWTAKTVNGI